VYGSGDTGSGDFVASTGAFVGPRGGSDAFVAKLDDTARTTPRTRVTSYQYDGLLRLIRARENPGTVYTSTYDLAGNRLQTWEDGALIASRSYNAANQVAMDALSGQAWSYDAAGNLLRDSQASSGYDALNRLITTTAGIQARAYGYNGWGTLITETVNGLGTRYAQDLVAPLSQVLSSTGGLTASHLYGRERLASVEASSRTWYVPDALGSVRVTLNTAGDVLTTHRYDPYGTPQLGDVPRSFGFTGEPHDTTVGLVNLRARWYHTSEGRFGVRDTLEDNVLYPQSSHRYAYTQNDPINFIDPTGNYRWRNVSNSPAHELIENDFMNNYFPFEELTHLEYPIPGLPWDSVVDVLLVIGEVGQLFEIEPVPHPGRPNTALEGIDQIIRYDRELDYAKANGDLKGFTPAASFYDWNCVNWYPGIAYPMRREIVDFGNYSLFAGLRRNGLILYWYEQSRQQRAYSSRRVDVRYGLLKPEGYIPAEDVNIGLKDNKENERLDLPGIPPLVPPPPIRRPSFPGPGSGPGIGLDRSLI
jgi:RHS repeat-associated protein